MLEVRKKETVVAFLEYIPDRLRATVEVVCTETTSSIAQTAFGSKA